MPREFVSLQQQQRWDREQWLDDECQRLRRLDAELVEWTFQPARDGEKLISAEFTLADCRRPLAAIAARLRLIAQAVEGLDLPPRAAARAKAA
jgi:hypothetical protein